MNHEGKFVRRSANVLGLVAGLLWVGAAQAQCVGDCDGNGAVAINELVVGVNIALGTSPISACSVFDANHSGQVEINELVAGVNNALTGCPASATPTATTAGGTPTSTEPTGGETPTATPTPATPTATPTVNALCGNGVVDPGETCDDGNTSDGAGDPADTCPANCVIQGCQITATTLNADVLIQLPTADTVLGALQVFVRYPDGIVSLPSSGSQAAVAISNLPDDAFNTSVNDIDYAVRVVSVGPGGLTLGDNNRFFTAQFTACAGAGAPAASAFHCTVENATDDDTPAHDLTAQTSCSVVLP